MLKRAIGRMAICILNVLCLGVVFASESNSLQSRTPDEICSGDGAIYVIPSSYPPSVKNGEKLSLSVIVKAKAGVARVTANLGGIETIALKPSSVTSDAAGLPTAGLWTAEWTGHDLEEKVYDITLRVTDSTGHFFEDKSLQFSDPAAGQSTPGTPIGSPVGVIREARSDAVFTTQDSVPFAAVYDPVRGEALFGTFANLPAQIIKVALNGPAGVPVRIGTITLNTGENNLHSAAYDPTTGLALFGCSTSPGIVVKVFIGPPGQLPQRIGAVTLSAGENSLNTAVWDPTNKVALFATVTNPSIVVKVAMNDQASPPTRQGAVTLNAAESNMACSIIDTVNGVALFGTDGVNPGIIAKVAVNGATGAPVRVNRVSLPVDECNFHAACFDAANNVALFAMHPTPSSVAPPKVLKIALNAPGDAPTRVEALTLAAGEEANWMTDPVDGTVLLNTDESPSKIIKINIGAANAAPTRVGTFLTLNPGEDRLTAMVTVPAQKLALFAGGAISAVNSVVKIAFGATPADAPVRVNSLQLNYGETGAFCAVYDPATRTALIPTGTFASRIVKVALGTPDGIPRRIGSVQLNPGETSVRACAYDPATGIALFITTPTVANTPSSAVKVAMNAPNDPPTRVGAVVLNAGELNVQSCAFDPVNGIALLGTGGTTPNPGIIIKVAMNQPAAAPTRVGAVTLPNAGEAAFVSAVADPANGVALFGSSLNPATVVKVAFGLPADPPTRVGALTLNAAENGLYAGVIDLAHNVALFQTDTSPNKIVKVALNLPGDAPTRVGATTLATGENGSNGAAFDAVNGVAIFSTFSSPSRVVAVAAGLAGDLPVRLSGTTLATGENLVSAVILDPALGLAFTANPTNVNRLQTLPYAAKSTIAGTRMTLAEPAQVTDVRFFSHLASGNLRLAIYDGSLDKRLLWQSGVVPNTATNAEVVAPISAGAPASLILQPGTYFLAWQTDSIAPVASFSAGAPADGFLLVQPFGSFMPTIPFTSQTITTDRYTEYITYAVAAGAVTALADPSTAGVKQTVNFAASAPLASAAATYAWNFGDGANGAGATTSHQYQAAGSYIATVTVTDGTSNYSNTVTVTVIAPNITVTADPSKAFTGVPLQFNAAAFFFTGANVTYAWTFGDGTTGTGANPTHAYLALGDYTATATATETGSGNTLSGSIQLHVTTVPVTIDSGPTPSSSPAGAGQTVSFTASATGAPGLTLTYTWDFGDGQTASGANLSHPFPTAGDYIVKVTVTDGVGGSATEMITLSVLAPVIGSGTNDLDGDGFSDGFETANNTLPMDGASTPFDNKSSITFSALTLIKPSIALNFSKKGADSIKFSGTLDIPDGFVGSGQHFYVVVGDVFKQFTLDAKNGAKTAAGSVKIAVKVKKGTPVVRQTGKYSVALSKGDFTAQLAPSGLTGDMDIKTAVSRSVKFALFFNNQTLQTVKTMLYTAKKDKSGKASAK